MIHNEYGWDIACPKDTTIRYGVGSKQLMGGYPITESKERPVENKSWNEFIVWSGKKLYGSTYRDRADWEKIGLIITYLQSKKYFKEQDDYNLPKLLTVESLEVNVKAFKPVDEVEEIKELLFEEGGISIWSEVKMRDLARKAIEIIKGK